jgi:hypothetical protein
MNFKESTDALECFADGILDELTRIRKALPDKVSLPPRLEPHHKQVLNYFAEQGSITQREYGEILSRSLTARKQDFECPLNLKLIEVEGIERITYYVRRVI